MTKVKWHARQGKVSLVDDSAITLDNDESYQTQAESGTATVVSTYMKDVTVTPPELEQDKIDTLGQNSNGFQNAFVNENPAGMATLSATLIMQGTELFEDALTPINDGTSFTSYGYASSLSGTKSLVVNFDDGTDKINIALKNAYIKVGDRKPSGTDGHWEQDIEAKCLPENYREQMSV